VTDSGEELLRAGFKADDPDDDAATT